jgi:hypothetical protein
MKNGLLLTLKQLIKLGIISFKKKKRRNKNKSKMRETDAFEKEITSEVPINPQNRRYNYSYSTSPPSLQPNSDALRLRDENDRLNVKMIESKNEMENQKKMINEQHIRHRELENDVDVAKHHIMRDLNQLNYYGKNGGFAYDDDIVVSQTYGSLTFQPQTSQPTTPEPSSAIPPTPRSLTEDDFFTSDAEQVLEPPPTNEPIVQSDSDEEINTPPITIKTKRKIQPRTRPRTRRGVSFSDEEGKPLTFEEAEGGRTASRSGAEGSALYAKGVSEAEGAGGGGARGASMNFLNEPVPKHNNYPFSPERIPYSKTKPSVAEVQQWKQWYLLLGLKDTSVLQMNTRSSYMKPILAKSLDEYKKLRGEKDPNILKSKDPRVVYKAVKQRLSGVS